MSEKKTIYPLVSIIIPTYNRAHLIGETLDSVIAQTYKNWECIVIDDGSSDKTLEVLATFNQKDSRIQYYHRPKNRKKGANACRNFGFKKSVGDYIIWFDSDDLMTPDHIESKLKLIQQDALDFVVARTQNFESGKFLEPYYYEKKEYGITASDFILLKIHWYTYDVILKRSVAEKIEWNEQMKSWQDYNYFCKMLLITENGAYLDKILTYRRLHKTSIQKSLTNNLLNFNSELLENRVLTYLDISENINPYIRKELIFGMMNICFELSKMNYPSKYIRDIEKIVEVEFGKKSKYYFKTALLSSRVLKKGHYFLNKAKQR